MGKSQAFCLSLCFARFTPWWGFAFSCVPCFLYTFNSIWVTCLSYFGHGSPPSFGYFTQYFVCYKVVFLGYKPVKILISPFNVTPNPFPIPSATVTYFSGSKGHTLGKGAAGECDSCGATSKNKKLTSLCTAL